MPPERERRPGDEAPIEHQDHLADGRGDHQDHGAPGAPDQGQPEGDQALDASPDPQVTAGEVLPIEPSTAAPAITLGAGCNRPQGWRLELVGDPIAAIAKSIAEHVGEEAWWSAHTWAHDKRDQSVWQAAVAVVLDLDCADHGVLSDDLADWTTAGLRDLANLAHVTPHGVHAVFVLSEPITNAEDFKRAARGAAALVKDALRAENVHGIAVDKSPTEDIVRLFYTPNATVTCKRDHAACADNQRRQAEVLFLRTAPWSYADLAACAPDRRAPAARSVHRSSVRANAVRNPEAYGRAALAAGVQRVEQAQEGERNTLLNATAFSLGRLVSAGILDETEARDALTAAGRASGLDENEILATIESGLQAGKLEPVALDLETSNTPPSTGSSLVPFVTNAERVAQDLLGAEGVQEGDEIRFRCPLPHHVDEDLSASFSPAKEVWYCRVCRQGGALAQVARARGINLPRTKSRSRQVRRQIIHAARREPSLPEAFGAVGQESIQHERPGSDRPTILVEGGLLPEIVDRAESALLHDGGEPIYQRGTLLVRAVRSQALTMREIYNRAVGILMLCAVESPYLAERLTRAARWIKETEQGRKEIDCPEKVARTLMSRKVWRVPRLLGVIEAPTLRPDGSILDQPGYDPQTCLLFDPGDTFFPGIPSEPTREEALAALAVFHELLKDFPWLASSDRSTAIAAILTVLIRQSLRSAPLTAFRAPKMASGKSLLTDVVAMIATGRVASVMSQGKDEEEDKKRLLAILMEGIQVACIDNIERPLGGAALCSILTQETWRERILGKTGTATVPTATTWLATGNNLNFAGDITTRVVVCDLDPMVERPEERKFDVDLHDYVPRHRGELVVAALTILRAYHVAGRPDQRLSVFGRFEQWSGWVRSALVWLGETDPCAGRHRLEDTDPVRRLLRVLLMAWEREIGLQTVTAGEVVARISASGEDKPGSLAQAVLEVAMGKGGKADSRRLGNYLSKYERRPEAGLRIERVGDRQGVALWRVARVGANPGGADGDGEDAAEGGGAGGFVGIVGPCQPVQSKPILELSTNGAPCSSPIEGVLHGPAGKVPREPHNPRPETAPADASAPDTETQGTAPQTHETHQPAGPLSGNGPESAPDGVGAEVVRPEPRLDQQKLRELGWA